MIARILIVEDEAGIAIALKDTSNPPFSAIPLLGLAQSPIAYIGLICPHLGRMMFSSDNHMLFPVEQGELETDNATLMI